MYCYVQAEVEVTSTFLRACKFSSGMGALLTTSNTTGISTMLHYLLKSCLIFRLSLLLLKTTANQWTPQSQAFCVCVCSSCSTPGIRDIFLDHLYRICDLATSPCSPCLHRKYIMRGTTKEISQLFKQVYNNSILS